MRWIAWIIVVAVSAACGESRLKSATRKHCNCGEPLIAVAEQLRANPTDTLAMGQVLLSYSEMIHCLGGEEEWKTLRYTNRDDYSNQLVKQMQEKCPDVLASFQQLGIYDF